MIKRHIIKIPYALVLVLMFIFIMNVSNANEVKQSISIIEDKTDQQIKFIFGTTNSPSTKLYKQADLILSHAFSKLGYQFSLINLPNKRNLLWANDGKIDGIAFRIASLNDFYPNLVRVDEALFSIEHWVYSRKKIKIEGWESLYPYSVAYEQGSLFIEENKHFIEHLIPAASSQSAFTLVYKKHADLTITSQSTGDAILALNQQQYKNEIKRQSPALTKTTMFSYLHKKHQALAVKLAQTLKTMKQNGEYQALLKQLQ